MGRQCLHCTLRCKYCAITKLYDQACPAGFRHKLIEFAMESDQFVFFIYDAVIGANLKEEDDPAEAVSYFYPSSWSSNEQCWLCGYLMGLSSQMSKILGQPPELIRLKKTKFALMKTERFEIALGVPISSLSDQSTRKLVEHMLHILLFFYPSLDSVMQVRDKQSAFETVMNTLFSRPWTDLEFQSIRFSKPSQVQQSVMLKCSDVLSYTSRHNGVVGCSLFFKESVIQSLASRKITRFIQFCILSGICCQKIEDADRNCRFVPVFVPSKEYCEMLKKHRRRLSDINWEENSFFSLGDTERTMIGSSPISNGIPPQPHMERVAVVDVKDSSNHPGTSGIVYTTEQTRSTTSINDDETTAQVLDESSSALAETKEMALCILRKGELSLVVLMKKYDEEYSWKVSQNISDGCITDLRYINEQLGEISDQTELAEEPGKHTIDYSSLTGKNQITVDTNENPKFRQMTVDANQQEFRELYMKNPKCGFKCNKLFGRNAHSFKAYP